MRRILLALACWCAATVALAGPPSIPPSAPVDVVGATDGLVPAGRMRGAVAALNAGTVNSLTTTTSSGNAYTAKAGAQPLQTILAAGQVYAIQFNAANTGAATLVVGTYAAKPIRLLNASGATVAMVGGEIVPGPAILYFDGAEYVYFSSVAPSVQVVSAAYTVTQGDWAGGKTFAVTASSTLTLGACSAALSPYGLVRIFALNGATATLATGSGCSSDTILKGSTSAASATFASGNAPATIVNNGSGTLYASGP